MDAALIAPATLFLRGCAGLIVIATLAHLLHRSPRAWLREWFTAWIAWVMAALLPLGLVFAPTTGSAAWPFLLSVVAVCLGAVSALFLVTGVREWSGAGPTRTARLRRNALIAAGGGLLVCLVIDAATNATSVRPLLAIAVPAAMTSIAAFVVAILAGRRLTGPWTVARAIILTSFAAIGVLELGFSVYVVARWMQIGTALLSMEWPVVAGWLSFAALAMSMVIAILDEERSAAVLAASQVEHLAYTDPLSGLPNRSLFFDRLVVSLAHAQRHRHKLAVLFLDLDRFKTINDSLGHSAGDAIIKQAAERLTGCVRRDDTVARFGGDEFIILLHIIARSEDAAKVAGKVLDAMSQPFQVGGREIILTGSIGIAVHPSDGQDAETLVRNADTAMYRAKEAGRHEARFYAPAMNARALEMLELESDLRRAITAGEFVLHYQPLIDVRSGKVYGTEALLRWNHRSLGLLSPDKFIDAAESTGLIIPIGNWVIAEACRQARTLQRNLGQQLIMSVNLSPKQFEQPDLASKIRLALSEAGLRGADLELEITESTAMADVHRTVGILNELKQLGVRIAIDDFGTGYSSLSYLRLLPVDTLKLDQSFVREITVPEDGAIASGVIAMAHSLKLTVLAEGVETLSQLEFLRNSECDRLQGFLFSRPLNPVMLEKFLASGGVRVVA